MFSYDFLTLQKYFKEKVQTVLTIENNTQNVLNMEIIKVSNKAIQTLDKVIANLDKKTINKFMNTIVKTVKEISEKFLLQTAESKPVSIDVSNK